MKKLFTFLIAIVICVAANSQVDAVSKSGKIDLNTKFVKSELKSGPRSSRANYVNETFDTAIPATWTINNTGTGSLPGWYWLATNASFPFTGFAVINSDVNGNGNLTEGTLTTPIFNCSAAAVVNLEFDVRYNDITVGGEDLFQVDVWDGTAWQNVIDWDADHGTAGAAEHVNIDISLYKNAACKVRFFYTDASAWDWYAGIDNVVIFEPEANDLGAISVSPSGAVTTGSTITPTVKIKNFGSASQSTYNVTLVSTPAGYNQTVSNPGAIAAGAELVVNFPAWTPADGDYTLTATVVLTGDAEAGNNVATSQIEVRGIGFGDLIHSFSTFAGGCPGIETDGNNIYTVYWDPSVALRNFDKYTMDGVFVEEFAIPGVSAVRDMAYNPNTGYFYGSAVSTSLFEMDLANKTLISTITIPIGAAARAILYDDDDNTFWSNNWASPVIEFDMTGVATGRSMVITSSYGLAYDNWTDPANPTFWVFTSDSGTPVNTLVEYEMDGTATGRQIDPSIVPGFSAGIGGGLASYEEGGYSYLLANIQQSPNLIAIFCLTAPLIDTYSATFTVTDGTDPIQGANVVVATLSVNGNTDASGQLVIADVAPGTYSYSVSATGYVPYDGTFVVVDQDITIPVVLVSTDIAEFNTHVSVVPNPSNGIITVSADQNYLVEVLDLSGRIIQSVNMNNNNASIDITSESNGMYIIRFTNENGTGNVKIIKK